MALLTLPVAEALQREQRVQVLEELPDGLCDSLEAMGTRRRGEQPVASPIKTVAAEHGALNPQNIISSG